MDVNGRVAVITGAASGIGFAIATAFGGLSARLALAASPLQRESAQ